MAILVLATAAAVAGCGSDDEGSDSGTAATGADTGAATTGDSSEPVSLRVAVIPGVTNLVLPVAEETGIFDENGLDVTIDVQTNVSAVLPALGQQYDFAFTTVPDLLLAAGAGIDVVSAVPNIGQGGENEDLTILGVMAAPDSGIESFCDLEGKRVASGSAVSAASIIMMTGVLEEGCDPDKVQRLEVPHPSIPDQMEAGRIDAAGTVEPFASQLLALGATDLGDPAVEYISEGDELISTVWAANGTWARENADIVVRFQESLIEAEEAIEENPKEARLILAEATGAPPQAVAQLPLPHFSLDMSVADQATDFEQYADAMLALEVSSPDELPENYEELAFEP